MIENTEAILLVDDEPENREAMSGALRSYGYAVFEADDYYSALGIFDQHQSEIDLLLSHVSLPGHNGCELAKKISGVRPDMKVLFVSGHLGAWIFSAYGLLITDLHFLRRPFHLEDLLQRVHDVLVSEETISAIVGEVAILHRSQADGAE